MKHTITFFPGNKTVEVEDGTTVFKAAVEAGIETGGNCGGTGSCGRCKVIIEGNCTCGKNPQISDEEYAQGYRLSCITEVCGDLTVLTSVSSGSKKIASFYDEAEISDFSPLTFIKEAEVQRPSMENSEADFERLRRALGADDLQSLPAALRKLSGTLRAEEWNVKAAVSGSSLIDIIPKNKSIYGLAVDIGTTTVALEIIDLQTGKTIEAASDYNHQIVCGEDVVSRMMYEEENGQERLTELILDTINGLIEPFEEEIHAVCIGGNTTMIHMLLGLETKNIRFEPYVPVTNFPPVWRASDIGIKAFQDAPVYIIPSCAGYVGGDITAGVLASKMQQSEHPSLLIDVGTNGEIALGCRDWLLTCSTSAGPSFEGGDLSCGMRGIEGAIDCVKIKDGRAEYSVIGNAEPKGICGSGIIDTVAQLFLDQKVDKKGRIKDGVFSLTEKIFINESDIENVIRTKAAIFAGCCVLLDAVSLDFNDLEKVYIAGGFGNYLDIRNAQVIGLLPPIPYEKFKLLGNASLSGAKSCLLSKVERQKAEDIAHSMTYIDLSSSNSFFDQYSSALFLPHTNEERFYTAGK